MDFANLFQNSSSSADAATPSNGLSGLFSDAAKLKFARSFKQTEFVPNEREEEPEPEMDERMKAKREKRKIRNMKSKPGAEEGDVMNTTETPTEVKEDKPETEESQAVEQVTEASKKDKDQRTIFIGNIPISYTTDKLSKLFSTHGVIESIRLRSIPVSGAKVDKAGDQDLVRKVCANSKKFGEQKGSVNAYIVYKEKAAVVEALKANNMVLDKRHLRIDTANPSLFDPKRTLFVGGLPFYADEEEIREFFAAKLPNGQDDIDGIRLIRDNETLVGKGIGYVLLKSRDLVLQALTLNETIFKKRWTLRVSSCGKRTKRSHDSSAPPVTNSNPSEVAVTEPKQKKPRREVSETSMQAMKRIRTKTVVTKKKLLQSRQKGGDNNKNNTKNSSKGNKSHSSHKKPSNKGKSPKK